ncbi:m7GpppN-mRNA hydrolase NUDT17 isoform X1 [Pelodiscus sinensis]|uniref:m7GpppN-mRNA hydrolase NUDT17 isoform X1 n=1 Tax=Pelodiscus sinensis TaxID=13735 RepID=UPI003F6AD583
MGSLARGLVRLAKGSARPQRAAFLQSVTGHFCAPHEDEATVNCGLDQNQFVISDSAFPGSTRVLLKRPSFCPIKHLEEGQAAALPEELRGRGVDVGVAVLLQSVDGRVLLTRRAKNLSIFPSLWVPPGGHLEPGEQVLPRPALRIPAQSVKLVAGGGPAGAAGGDRLAAGARQLLLEDAGPMGVRLPSPAEPRAAAAAPHHCLPLAAFHRGPPAAAEADQGGGERGERLRVAGGPRAGVHRGRRGWCREHEARAQQPPPNHQSHRAERGRGPAHGASYCHVPEHGSCNGGRRGTGQHRDPVCPAALARHHSHARHVSSGIPGPGLPAGQTGVYHKT